MAPWVIFESARWLSLWRIDVSPTPSPIFEGNLANYFRDRLEACAKPLKPQPTDDALSYMAQLMARLSDSRQLFSFEAGRLHLRPFALLYKDAHEAQGGHQRCLILRQLGDQALFVGALFPESYARHGLKQEYFIGMGGGAYDYLSDHAARTQRSTFAELAQRFTAFLGLVADACHRNTDDGDADVIALYQAWLLTGDQRVADRLAKLGVTLDSGTTRH